MLGRNAKRKYAAEWRDLTYYSMISASFLGPGPRNGRGAEWDFTFSGMKRGFRCGGHLYLQAQSVRCDEWVYWYAYNPKVEIRHYTRLIPGRGGEGASGHVLRCYENQAVPAPYSAARAWPRTSQGMGLRTK